MKYTNIRVSDGDLDLLIEVLGVFVKGILDSYSHDQRPEKQHFLPLKLLISLNNLKKKMAQESGSTTKNSIRK